MDAVQEVRSAFSASRETLNNLHQHLEPQLAGFAASHGYTTKGRVKELASVATKLQQGRYKSWTDLDDLVAFTVVVPTRSHEERVEQWLDQQFERIRTLSRSNVSKAPDTFRFDSMRWYGRVPEQAILTEDRKPLRRFTFEVQIKTVFDDAWGVVTHDLVYKGDDPSWGRARLASQLKAAIEQIDALVDQFESAASQVPSSPHPETKLISEAIETVKDLFESGHLDPNLRPNSWTSLMNNVWSFSRRQKIPETDSYRRPQKVFPKIVDGFAEAVRAGDFSPLLSATLFDAIVAWAITSGRANGDEFFLVRSETMATTFGLTTPKEIDLGPAFDS